MFRTLALVFFLTAVAGLVLADRPDTKTKVADANLELELPESSDPPSYAKDRISHLVIDGKDFSTPRDTTRKLKVEPKKDSDTVTVVYTFWPNTYTKIIRTKKVKLEKGKLVKASLMKEDKETPDQIRPIYVPTPDEVVDAMCKMAKITKDDVVYDIGCGDGRLVIAGVKKFKAKKGVGIDINPELVKKCNENAKKAGVSDKVKFIAKDCQTIKDFSEATVVLLYLGDYLNKSIRPTLQKTLKPGSRIVSHRFLMGDWKPDKSITITARDNYDLLEEFKLHLWTIKKKQ